MRNKLKIVHQCSVLINGLRPDSCTGINEVFFPNRGKKLLECANKSGFIERPIHLCKTCSPILLCHPPETREANLVENVSRVESRFGVAFAFQGESGVRP